jgi:ubiquitin carboxyl-terminal hydrolase 8
MEFEKYKHKGLSGLANLGNTCFINSCMQILSHTYEINELLDNEKFKNKLNSKLDTVLLLEWDELRKVLWNQNCVVAPKKFLNAIHKISTLKKNPQFTGFNQNDVSEFLLFMIDCFHNSISREINMTVNGDVKNDTDKIALKCFETIKSIYSKDYSEFWGLFYAMQISEMVSTTDAIKVLSMKPEPFMTLDLPIPETVLHSQEPPSLYDCIDLYSKGSLVENWLNEETNEKETIQLRTTFWSFPNILIIDLKRFSASRMMSKMHKNNCYVNFPLENLDLSKYVVGYKKEKYVYDLYGVANHMGNMFGGHYTAYVKNANEKWYYFDDARVTEVTNANEIVSERAYVLFYRIRVA